MAKERDTVRLTWATYNYQSPLRLPARAILIHWLVKSAASKKKSLVEIKQSYNALSYCI
jgi:hypothetical protein